MKRTKQNNQEKQQLALETFGSENFLSINKKLLSHFGPELTVYVGNLIDKMQYFSSKGKLKEDNSFFLTQADQAIQTGMSEYQLRKCKNKLKKMGILTTQMRGVPPKEFYILHIDILVEEFLRNNPLVFKGLNVKKLKDYSSKNLRNIKEHKYKEHKYKEHKYRDIIPKNNIENLFPPEWKENDSFQNVLKEFILHRKEKHQPITPRAGKMLANKLSKYSIQEAIVALTQSIENGWTGVFPESNKNKKSPDRNNKYQGTDYARFTRAEKALAEREQKEI